MNSFIRLSFLLVGLLAFSDKGQCMDAIDPDLELSEHLQQLNATIEAAYEGQTDKKSFRTKNLDEAISLRKHRLAKGNLEKLPYAFVKKQIERAREYANKKFNASKKIVLETIISDLNLSEGQDVDQVLYNCTVKRVMALSALEREEANIIKPQEIPAFLEERKPGNSDGFLKVNNLKTYLNHEDGDKQTFYNILAYINLENLKIYSEAPYNYSFVRFLSPKNTTTIFGETPFIGTQTLSYALLNDLLLEGGSLNPNVSAHGWPEYDGSFGVLDHDEDHNKYWLQDTSKLKEHNIYHLIMHTFIDIFEFSLQIEDLQIKNLLSDFLFILMHEDSPIGQFHKVFPAGTTVTTDDLLNQFATYSLPGPSFQELGAWIARNGYPGAGKTQTYSASMEEYRRDMMQLLKVYFKWGSLDKV